MAKEQLILQLEIVATTGKEFLKTLPIATSQHDYTEETIREIEDYTKWLKTNYDDTN